MMYKSSKDIYSLKETEQELLNKLCECEPVGCDLESSIELVDSDTGEHGLFIKCNKCNLKFLN